ncbi:DUF2854 domain-containing protein [Leptolyngbya sp. FACHB-261]|uniref:DUF2854 domain-containing protein n=1 Tax=Leptolyngbya sp. FACHB-261 TaxID=2692806 RepID=UPI001687AA76|nr:DUF2854 domain-containing protein [Leptolyngbya sp. FACHB-261]MBD2104154.1 DUF2854 domain-containing protein [Leptolyngbya sp. FACHB-261]
MLRRVSLGSLGLTVGGILTLMGFVAYFGGNPTLNLIGFFYGIPILLGGAALKASETKPVQLLMQPNSEVLALRQKQQTETLKKVREKATGYLYGEAHLEESLKPLGLEPTDEERPILTHLGETIVEGAYTLVLRLHSPLIDFASWQERRDKIERFFGPGIRAELEQPTPDTVDLSLIVVP